MTWGEIKRHVGRDPAATLVYLYVDALSRVGGLTADALADPVIVLEALADEHGCIDPDILNGSEARGLRRYRNNYQLFLEPITDATWARYRELCFELGL